MHLFRYGRRYPQWVVAGGVPSRADGWQWVTGTCSGWVLVLARGIAMQVAR